DGDPFFDEPVVDGAPLYLGAEYDPGTRVGRITHLIGAMTADGKKLSLSDMQSIQADAVSEWSQALTPTLLAAATSLVAELASPGTNPELGALASSASTAAKALLPQIVPVVSSWTFDTPSGAAEDNPTPQQI